jgi:ribosomal-protein-alanine N-acetyltransferase
MIRIEKLPSAEIRPAAEGDIPCLTKLENAIFSDPWREADIAFAVNAGQAIVFASDGEISGYLIFSGDESEIDIAVLAVDEKYRRQGIGRKLIEKIAEQFPRAALWLEVREKNETARVFYKKIGFNEHYRRRDYYKNPEDNAVIMARPPVH